MPLPIGAEGSRVRKRNCCKTSLMKRNSARLRKKAVSARPAVPRLFLWERNSSGRKSKSSLQRYVSLTITMKHSNAGTVVRTGGHIRRSHPCPVWSSGTLMRLLPLLSGSSIRSVSWPYRCTVRKTNPGDYIPLNPVIQKICR